MPKMDREAIQSLIAELRRCHGELEGVEAKAAAQAHQQTSLALSAFANQPGGGALRPMEIVNGVAVR
jgi:hypothetical protein